MMTGIRTGLTPTPEGRTITADLIRFNVDGPAAWATPRAPICWIHEPRAWSRHSPRDHPRRPRGDGAIRPVHGGGPREPARRAGGDLRAAGAQRIGQDDPDPGALRAADAGRGLGPGPGPRRGPRAG